MMAATSRCGYGGYCIRICGHKGVHTADPSGVTLDFDEHHRNLAKEAEDAATLLMLDMPTPHWADLND